MKRIRTYYSILAAVALVLPGIAGTAHSLGLQKIGVIAPSGADRLMNPGSFCYDSVRGYFIVANTTQRQILVLAPDGRVVKVLGEKNGIGFPVSVGVNRQGTLFFSEKNSETIRILARYDSVVGQEYSSLDLSSHRRSAPVQPAALLLDEFGNLFVADRANRQVLIFGSDAKFLSAISEIGDPADIGTEFSGNILVADPGLGGIKVFSADGKWRRTLGTNPVQFREPLRVAGVAADRKGRIWAVEAAGQGIIALDYLGNRVFTGGKDLFSPVDLAIDLQDNLYVLEQGANRISVYRISEF